MEKGKTGETKKTRKNRSVAPGRGGGGPRPERVPRTK